MSCEDFGAIRILARLKSQLLREQIQCGFECRVQSIEAKENSIGPSTEDNPRWTERKVIALLRITISQMLTIVLHHPEFGTFSLFAG